MLMNKQTLLYICLGIVCILFGCVKDQSKPLPKDDLYQNRYYVSPSGNDNNSGNRIDQPWKTIEKATQVLQPGDTVFIREGTYNEIVIPQYSGTKENHITYTSYPNETAIIDGSNYANTYLQYYDRGIVDLKTKQYINIIGLKVQNSAGAGITSRYGSSHITIIDNAINNCFAPGIAIGYSREDNPMAHNIVISKNYVENCAQRSREAISLRSVDTFEINENVVINTPKEGIDVKSGSSNGRIYNNKIHLVKAVGIYIDGGYPDDLYPSSRNIQVFNNEVKNCKTSIAVASENLNVVEKIDIYNNVIYDTQLQYGDGIVLANFGESGSLKNIQIVNNTIFQKGNRGIYINNLNVEGIIISNNICSQNRLAQIDIKSNLINDVILENNLIDGVSVDKGYKPVLSSPLFRSESDFHLSKSSPAIDTGSPKYAPEKDYDNIPRPKGKGYDIGAYEF